MWYVWKEGKVGELYTSEGILVLKLKMCDHFILNKNFKRKKKGYVIQFHQQREGTSDISATVLHCKLANYCNWWGRSTQ